MAFVLDTSVLLSGRDVDLGAMYCTPDVFKELIRKGATPQVMSMIEAKVEIRSPSKQAVVSVRKVAERTGDIKRLSPVDIGVLALALDLGATIITDDYSIQNVANEMGVDYKGLSFPDITRKVEWSYKCVGCRREFPEALDICPVCGSKIKTSPRSISQIFSASSDRSE